MNRTFRLAYEIIAVGLLLAVCYPLFRYGSLEGVQVPWHYSNGAIDSWGGRSIFIWLAVIATVIYGLLWLAGKFPQLINIPGIDTREKPQAARTMASALKMWSMALFAWLSIPLYLMAIGKTARPLIGVLYIILAAAVLHSVYLIYALRR